MKKIADIIQALFLLYVAWWGLSYYMGRVNYTADREERRQERVQKYGWLLIIAIIVASICGLSLLILAVT